MLTLITYEGNFPTIVTTKLFLHNIYDSAAPFSIYTDLGLKRSHTLLYSNQLVAQFLS